LSTADLLPDPMTGPARRQDLINWNRFLLSMSFETRFTGCVHPFHMQDLETHFTSTPRVRAHRRCERQGTRRLPIDVTKAQLDQLEVRGYLDPDRRGDRADECNAIEWFLAVELAKSG
jgi:hypothetical protein